MYTIVCLQLVLEAEPLATAVALVRLLPSVDTLVAPQCPVIPKTAPAVLALKRVIACKKHVGPSRRPREKNLISASLLQRLAAAPFHATLRGR